MPTSSESSRSSTAVLLSAPGLSVVALVLFVLFVLFASLVAPALFPLQLLDPAWQVRFAGTLINTAAFPLLGLALLQIAAEIGPHDPQLNNRARLCSELAVAGAASNADLNQQLQKLQGPMLLSGGVRGSQPHKARSCPQASPTSASTAATSPSLR